MNNIYKDYKPFDVVIYKPTGERGLVKSTNDIGAFVLFRIQSTAALWLQQRISVILRPIYT